MVGGDGNVYEGRGLDSQGVVLEQILHASQNGSNIVLGKALSPDSNSTISFESFELTYGLIIAFIGNFNEASPSEAQVSSFNRFLVQSESRNVLTEDFKVLLEDQVVSRNISEGLLKVLQSRQRFHLSEKNLDFFGFNNF